MSLEQQLLSHLWQHLDLLPGLGVTGHDFRDDTNRKIYHGLEKQAVGKQRVAKMTELTDYVRTEYSLTNYLKPDQRLDKVSAKSEMEFLVDRIKRDNQRQAVRNQFENMLSALDDGRRNPWNVTAEIAEKLTLLSRKQDILEPRSAPDVMEDDKLTSINGSYSYKKCIACGLIDDSKTTH